jgi:chorismate mutase
VATRAVRGATQLERDDRDHMLDRVAELVLDVMSANGLDVDDFISVIFTATSDLVVRMLAHVETELPRGDITHVYLHGAAALRSDLTRVRTVPDESGERDGG